MKLSLLDTESLEDVTVSLGEDNAGENRLYRSATGLVLKVKVLEMIPSPYGMRVFKVTASECDETGRARPYGDGGYRIAPEHVLTVHMNPTAEPASVQLEAARRQQAALILAAIELEDAELEGVGTTAMTLPPPLET